MSQSLLIVFPLDPNGVIAVDYSFKAEHDACLMGGSEFDVVCYDHDLLINDGRLNEMDKYSERRDAVLRGWMMTDVQYRVLAELLEERNIYLVNTPEMYCLTHYYPNVYPLVREYASPTIYFEIDDFEDVHLHKEEITEWLENNPKFIVKDYVKSAKHKGFLTYENDDNDYDSFILFLKKVFSARGSLFNKGFVFKQYLNVKPTQDNILNEIRIFIYNKSIVSAEGNNNIDVEIPIEDIQPIISDVTSVVNSTFFTIDLVECETGWRIIELGDGQVSGLATQDYPECFYSNLKNQLQQNNT